MNKQGPLTYRARGESVVAQKLDFTIEHQRLCQRLHFQALVVNTESHCTMYNVHELLMAEILALKRQSKC